MSGFLERQRGRYSSAVEKFLESEKVGRKGAAIKREISHCYLLMNKIKEAVKYISEAISLQPDNRYVVDLAVKIYLKAGMEEKANNALNRLELIDNSEYYLLRKSTFEYKFGRYNEAELSAKKSFDLGGKRFFPAHVQLTRCYIKNRKFDMAQKCLNNIDKTFPDRRRDIKIALECSLLIL